MPAGLMARLIRRELRQNRQQTTVLFLCIALAVVGLTALGGIQANVHEAMRQQIGHTTAQSNDQCQPDRVSI